MEQNTARNFALQLGSLIALYASLSAIIMLMFGVINIAYPDAMNGYWEYSSAQDGIRFAIAMLVVFFPTYIVLTRMVNTIRRSETGAYLTLTKWLIYLSLLVGGAIVLGDLVTVILAYLNGEVTVRFLLKALTLIVVIGPALYYYTMDAKTYWNSHEKQSKQFGLGVALVVVGVIVLGFLNSDTPSEVRNMRLDEQQITDLSDMQWRIEDHYRINKSLPTETGLLYIGIPQPTAPEGREDYTYKVIDNDTYELCAVFAGASKSGDTNVSEPVTIDQTLKNPYNNWDHGAGKTCFERTVVEVPKMY